MNYQLLLATDGYIQYNKHIARTVGVEEAIMVGLLCSKYNLYREQEKLTIIDGEEYFYCTREWIEKETALKEDRQRRAMKTLEEAGILKIKKVGLPSKNHYCLCKEGLDKLFDFTTSSAPDFQPLEVVNSDLSNNKINKTKEEKQFKDNVEQNSTPQLFTTKTTIRKNTNEVEEVIEYLNDVLKTRYSPDTASTVKDIKSIIKAGYTVEDIKTVISYKYKEWKGTEMEQYLRPSTLFRFTKFESYFNNAIRNVKTKRNKLNDTDDGRAIKTAFRELSTQEQQNRLAKKEDGSLMTF